MIVVEANSIRVFLLEFTVINIKMIESKKL